MPADHSADLVPAARPAVLPLQESHVRAATLQESGFPDIAQTLPAAAQTLPAAVLWDMDGTLIDSERLWSVSLHDTARELGGTLGPQARESLTGVDIDTSIRVLLDEVGRPATPELVAATRERLLGATAALFDGGVDWLPGARDALRTVRATGLPTALVTNSVRQIAELALDGIGRGFFDVTVCGDEVPAGKPAPDPYLRAAELLGVPAESCLVVEDSHNGALAGERAGAAVLVVAGEVPVPAGPRRTHRRGLVGLSTAELAAAADLPAARDVRVA